MFGGVKFVVLPETVERTVKLTWKQRLKSWRPWVRERKKEVPNPVFTNEDQVIQAGNVVYLRQRQLDVIKAKIGGLDLDAQDTGAPYPMGPGGLPARREVYPK